jgi:hypothetical protein
MAAVVTSQDSVAPSPVADPCGGYAPLVASLC